MTDEMLARIVNEIDSLGLDEARFNWHGGEPLMLGLGKFEKVVELQSQVSTRFLNSVQTNATLIDEEFAKFFAERNFSVGVSIDGPKHVQDYNRPLPSGSSFDRAISGIQLLHKWGIRPSSISVITARTEPTEYFHFMQNLGVRSFSTKPCRSEWKESIELEQYSSFLEDLLHIWLDADDPDLISRNLMGYIENILSGRNSMRLCSQSGQCGHFAVIDVNGDVYPCDELADKQHLWGNLGEMGLGEILSGQSRASFLEEVASRTQRCSDGCEAFVACQGGCTSAFDACGKDYCNHIRRVTRAIRSAVEQGLSQSETEIDESLIDQSLRKGSIDN